MGHDLARPALLSKRKPRLKGNFGVPRPNLLTAEEHAQLAKDQKEWELKNADRIAKRALAAKIERELDAAGIKK